MRNQIVEGHVLDVLKDWPDGVVNAIITSPPYWGLRAYNTEPVVWGGRQDCEHSWQATLPRRNRSEKDATTEKQKSMKGSYYTAQGGQFCSLCNAWKGELGSEPTPELYIEHLMAVFDALKSVLRDDGICFVNISDTYAGGKGQSGSASSEEQAQRVIRGETLTKSHSQLGGPKQTRPSDGKIGVPAKSLCLIPERFVLAMQQHGWIVRCKIVWAKGVSFCDTYSGSCMPDSAKDRPNKNGYEMVYMFTKKKHYWYEQLFEPMQESNAERPRMGQGNQTIYNQKRKNYVDANRYGTLSEHNKFSSATGNYDPEQGIKWQPKERAYNPLGRTIRNVWCINPQAYSEAHFATYPEKLVEPLIKMAVPEQVCKKCGLGRKKIYDKGRLIPDGGGQKTCSSHWLEDDNRTVKDKGWNLEGGFAPNMLYEQHFKGLADCGCNKGWRPGIVLDCFCRSRYNLRGRLRIKERLYRYRIAA